MIIVSDTDSIEDLFLPVLPRARFLGVALNPKRYSMRTPETIWAPDMLKFSRLERARAQTAR